MPCKNEDLDSVLGTHTEKFTGVVTSTSSLRAKEVVELGRSLGLFGQLASLTSLANSGLVASPVLFVCLFVFKKVGNT